MNKTVLITWILLLILTVTSAIFANVEGKYIAYILLGFTVLKFIGVAFQFMELKKAHPFWKLTLVSFLLIFILVFQFLF